MARAEKEAEVEELEGKEVVTAAAVTEVAVPASATEDVEAEGLQGTAAKEMGWTAVLAMREVESLAVAVAALREEEVGEEEAWEARAKLEVANSSLDSQRNSQRST